MYWIEENENPINVVSLSNNQIIDNITYIESKYEFFYCKELRRLEKLKTVAIIRDLDEFENAQKQYNHLKSMSPEIWFENWETYKLLLEEAGKRNLSIPHPVHSTSNMLCFG